MARSLTIPRLGVGGRNTDKPTWALRPDELADGSRDGIVYEGAMRRRRGATVANSISSTPAGFIGTASFKMYWPHTNRKSVLSFFYGNDGVISIRGPGTGSRMFDGSTEIPVFPFSSTNSAFAIGSYSHFLPRATLNGELICCDTNGRSPLWRYAGPDPTLASVFQAPATKQYVTNQSVINFTGAAKASEIGSFLGIQHNIAANAPRSPVTYHRVTASSLTQATLKDVRALATSTSFFATQVAIGLAYPAVEVYSGGTISINSTTYVGTGVGTKWGDLYLFDVGSSVFLDNNSVLVTSSTPPEMFAASFNGAGLTDTNAPTVVGRTTTDANHIVASRLPFSDVCVYEESLYGVGVYSHPNRVYIGPAGWNIGLPPGATTPFDIATFYSSSNVSDYMMDFIDVPSENDSDRIEAILPTDGPRLVLKEKSVYGIYGSLGNLSVRLIHSGDGCIDLRSAISGPDGAFWAGNNGVYRYRFGQFQDLVSGWMRNEWRALVNAGIDYCTMGVDGRNLIVSIKTADAAQQKRTYVFDLELGRWMPEITNIYPRHMFSANITGEIQQLLCVDDAYPGKVINLRPALDNSGPARDEVGTGPNFKLVTGDGLVANNGIEGESRVLEVDVSANVQDAAGTTTLSAKVTHGGALRGDGAAKWDGATTWNGSAYWGPDNTKATGNIASDADATMKRTELRVDRLGRRAGLVLEETTTSSTVGDVEIGEVVVRMRDTRKGT